MKKEEVMIEKVFLLIFGVIIFSVVMVFAVHTIGISNGDDEYTFNEDITSLYNVSINVTTDGTMDNNVTQINFTLPSSILFLVDSQNISTIGNFTNTTSILSWSNFTGYLFNGSINNTEFSFNATGSTPGVYNISVVMVSNNWVNINYSNLSVVISDTTAPDITIDYPVNNTNYTGTSININITSADNNVTDYCWYNLTGSTANHSMSGTTATAFNATNTTVEGTYVANFWCNDSDNNVNNTELIKFTIDNTVPTISKFECTPSSPTSADTISCICEGNDAGSNISSIVWDSSPPATIGENILPCIATDTAGNSYQSNLTYTVTSASGSGPSSSGGAATYTKTYVISDAEFKAGYTKGLKTNEKARFNVNGITHNVGVTSLSTTTATISVFSTPQSATLQIGDIRKFDVNGNNYYDISIKLESIESNKANILISSVNELITEETSAEETTKEDEGLAAKEEETKAEEKNLTWLWILIILIILVLVWFGYKKYKN
jgi:hypothetical protein